MFRPRNTLLDAALAYAAAGIAIRPAPALVHSPAKHDAFGHWICSCADLICEAPGEHVAPAADWTTSAGEIDSIWQSPAPPNLLATSGLRVSFWHVPRISGAEGLRLFEQQRPGPWTPQLKLPNGDWVLATLPPAGDVTLPTGVVYLEPGVPVLVPPSCRTSETAGLFGSRTRMRWQDASRFPRAPLPSAEDILRLVGQAEQDRIELLGGVHPVDVA